MMEPYPFAHAFPFVPPDVLCRIHDIVSTTPPPVGSPCVGTVESVVPPGKTVGSFDERPVELLKAESTDRSSVHHH